MLFIYNCIQTRTKWVDKIKYQISETKKNAQKTHTNIRASTAKLRSVKLSKMFTLDSYISNNIAKGQIQNRKQNNAKNKPNIFLFMFFVLVEIVSTLLFLHWFKILSLVSEWMRWLDVPRFVGEMVEIVLKFRHKNGHASLRCAFTH